MNPLLLVLVGPTASGKTGLSLRLAQSLGGEIVSCDSVAVYRGMDLGSAKPSRVEQNRVPHHMIDVVTPDVEYTAGDYARAARSAVADIAALGRVPIVVGGTGLYLRALLDGLSAQPQRDEALRERLHGAVERRGPGVLHRALRRLDPAASRSIHPNDQPKLIRAIEVSVLAGKPMSATWAEQGRDALHGYRVVQMGLQPPRALLYPRIDARCAGMFADGLVEETKALVAQYGGGCRALGSLGYAEAQAFLRGAMTEAEAVGKAQQGHRNYSKRQGTWFRRDARIQWLDGFGEDALESALELVRLANEPAPAR